MNTVPGMGTALLSGAPGDTLPEKGFCDRMRSVRAADSPGIKGLASWRPFHKPPRPERDGRGDAHPIGPSPASSCHSQRQTCKTGACSGPLHSRTISHFLNTVKEKLLLSNR